MAGARDQGYTQRRSSERLNAGSKQFCLFVYSIQETTGRLTKGDSIASRNLNDPPGYAKEDELTPNIGAPFSCGFVLRDVFLFFSNLLALGKA